MSESHADPIVVATEPDPTSTRSQALRAQARLREWILAGALAPHERLTEQALAARLGASRTPIRAALARLADEGLLAPLPNGGYAVQSYSAEEIRDAIEIRGTLEGLAVRLAAERGVAPARLALLESVLAEIDRALEATIDAARFDRYMLANARFHELIGELPDSTVLARQLQRIAGLPFASPSAFVTVQSTDPSSHDTFRFAQAQHRLVVEAIVAREGARAEALMREHARIAHRNLRIALADPQARDRVPGGALVGTAASCA